MLRWAVKSRPGPVAIRYPRGGNGAYSESNWHDADEDICIHRTGRDVTVITYGTLINNAISAAELLAQRGIEATVLRLLSINPLNIEKLACKMSAGKHVFIIEEIASNCGIGAHLSCLIRQVYPEYHVDSIDLGNQYVQHGAVEKLRDYYNLSPEKLAQRIMEVQSSEN